MTPIVSHSLINSVVLISPPHLFIPGDRAFHTLQHVFMFSYCLAPYWCWEQLYSGAVVGLLNRDQLNLGHVPTWIRTSPWEESPWRSCWGRRGAVPGYSCSEQERGVTLRRWRGGWAAPQLFSLSPQMHFNPCVCECAHVRACRGALTPLLHQPWSWGVVLVKVIREDVCC